MIAPRWRIFLSLCACLLAAATSSRAQEVTLTPHQIFATDETPTALAFSGNGQLLLAGGDEGRLARWNVERTTQTMRTRVSDAVLFIGFLSGDTSFVVVDRGGAVSIGATAGDPPEASFQLDANPLAAALDAGKRYLAVTTDDEQIRLFDLQANMALGRIDARDQLDELVFLGFDRLGEQLIAITRQGTVRTWNPKTQRLMRKLALSGGALHGSQSVIQAAAANRQAGVFVVGLQEVALPHGGIRGRARPGDLERRHVVIAYDWDSGLEIKRIEYPDGPIRHVALGPGRDHVVVTDDDGSALTLVDLDNGELAQTVALENEPRTVAVAFSLDDRWLAGATEDGQIGVWAVERSGPPSAATQGERLPTLSGRIRVLSDDAPALTPDQQAHVAVLPFEGRGDTERAADICSDVLATQLAGVEHLTLLERERIDEVLAELNLQASNLTTADGARIGRLLNADYLILGSLNALGTTYMFNARLLHVETSQITDGRQVICEECRFQDVFDAIHLLGTTLAR